MAAMARAELIRSEGFLPGLPFGYGAQDFDPIFAAVLGHKQGSGLETEQLEHELMLIRDAGTTHR